MDAELKVVLLKAVFPVLSVVSAYIAYWLREVAKKYLATVRFSQETGILMDACKKVLAKKALEKKIRYLDMIKDLHIDSEELAEIKRDALDVANESLKNLRGYVADEGAKRISERLDYLLGELQFLVIASLGGLPGTSASDSEEETDPQANETAS